MNSNKQRLFEVMGKVDPTFKPIDEIGTKLASKTFQGSYSGADERKKELIKNAFNSLFSKYLGRDLPFYLKIYSEDNPIKYKLIEIVPRSEYTNGNDDFLVDFYFFSDNENAIDDDAPYASYKKNIKFTYSVLKDDFLLEIYSRQFNQFFINFFIFAANTIRQVYFNYSPIMLPYDHGKREINVEATENAKKSKLQKHFFDMFPFDSKNLMNFR